MRAAGGWPFFWHSLTRRGAFPPAPLACAEPWELILFGVIGGAVAANKVVSLETYYEALAQKMLLQKMERNHVRGRARQPAVGPTRWSCSAWPHRLAEPCAVRLTLVAGRARAEVRRLAWEQL